MKPKLLLPKYMMKEKTKRYEILENAPNLRLKIFGSSPKDLFKNAIHALGHTQKPDIVEQSAVGALIRRLRGNRLTADFSIESMDYNTLLVDFLGDVLSRSDSQNVVFFDVKFASFSENKVEGRIYGVKIADFDKNIKAVDYNEISIKEVAPGKWESPLVLDI